MRAFFSTLEPLMQSIQSIQALVADELAALDQMILEELYSDVALINQVGHYIINAGGKRLRPLLAILGAQACGYHDTKVTCLATLIEFIHTATLLHDDVVDDSHLRRGRSTANDLWGNAPSVLVGDFLYSRSFQLMNRIGSLSIMQIMADTTNLIAEGEVLQLMNCNDPDTAESQYMQVIHYKTAALFAAATRASGVLAEAADSTVEALAQYGLELGVAFQLIDDVLDYQGNTKDLGKNIGDDLAEGKPTLPLIYAIQSASSETQAQLRRAIEHGAGDQLPQLLSIVKKSGGVEYTTQKAREAAHKAKVCLTNLPASQYKDALISLADLAVNRSV